MREASGGQRAALGALMGLLALRLVSALRLSPGRDELAYWWWSSRGPEAGHSPVTTGAIGLSTALLGDSALAIRLPGFLAAAAAAGLVAAAVRRLGGSRTTAALGALGLAGSLWQAYVGTVAHPDAWLTLWVALFGFAAADLARAPRGGRLVVVALSAALAALTKLPGAVLFVPAAWLLLRRARQWPAAAAAGAAILAGAAAWLAVVWDGRAVGALRELGRFPPEWGWPERLGLTVGEVALLAGPALLLLAGAGAWALRDRRAREAWPAGAAAAGILAAFSLALLAGQAKGNWFLPAAVLLLPPGAVALAEAGRTRVVAAAVVAAALLPLGLGGLLATSARWPESLDRTYAWHTGDRERRVSPAETWHDRFGEYRAAAPQDPRVAAALSDGATVVASPDYGLAFSAVWRSGRNLDVWIPGDGVFAATCGPPPAGSDVLWLTRTGRTWRDPPPRFVREDGAGTEPALEVFRCRSFAGVAPAETEREAMFARTGLALLLGVITTAGAEEPVRPDHAPLDALLREYVTPYGVRYAAWRENEDDWNALRAYVRHLQAVPISSLEAEAGARDEALAYWINLYNATTLAIVLKAYPVDSIKDLGNLLTTPWKRKILVVEGEQLSLDDIENAIIRPRFSEPRIHFALNCASIGCPPLRRGAYSGAELSRQLEQQTTAFLGDPGRNWVDEDGTVHLSKVLDWYEDDFVEAAGSVLEYVRPYMPMLQELKPGSEPRVRYVDYDWSLNESPEP